MAHKPKRIGVFGGTFDPIHNAHLAMAQAAMRSAGLDRVLFVVSASPPHKRRGPLAGAEDRYAMVSEALADEPGMAPSRVELDRPGPSYMADTLRILQDEYGDAELFLILGMDSLSDLPNWRAPQDILGRARILAIPRPGHWSVPESLNGHYEVVPFQETTLSSTAVRARIASGEPCDDLVPPCVVRLIEERAIYDDTGADGAG